jgi:hypothetical protein
LTRDDDQLTEDLLFLRARYLGPSEEDRRRVIKLVAELSGNIGNFAFARVVLCPHFEIGHA